MGSKTKAVQTPFQNTTTNTFTEWTPSNTPDIQAARESPAVPETLAPALQAQFDRAQQRSADRWGSAYNQNIPAVTRNAMLGRENRDYQADYGAALGQSAYDANNANFARKMGIAEMTMGRPLQTGGTSSGYNTQVMQTPSIWGSIIGGAANVGGAAIIA